MLTEKPISRDILQRSGSIATWPDLNPIRRPRDDKMTDLNARNELDKIIFNTTTFDASQISPSLIANIQKWKWGTFMKIFIR
jgi:hypothetical protein